MFYTIYWPIPVEVLVRVKYTMFTNGHARCSLSNIRRSFINITVPTNKNVRTFDAVYFV